jgi:hypothetical protein
MNLMTFYGDILVWRLVRIIFLIIGEIMSQHDTLLAAFETYKAENEKFIEKGIKASAARARKALQEIAGACKERRKEITAIKESMEAKK